MKLSECKGQSFLINGEIKKFQTVLKMIYDGKLFGPISLVNIDDKYSKDLSGVMDQMGGSNEKDKNLGVLQTEMIEIDITKDDLRPLNASNTMFAIEKKDPTVILLSECLEDDYMFICNNAGLELSDILGLIYNRVEIPPIQVVQMDTMFSHENSIAMQRLWGEEIDNNKELSLLKQRRLIIDIKAEEIEKVDGYDDIYIVKQKKEEKVIQSEPAPIPVPTPTPVPAAPTTVMSEVPSNVLQGGSISNGINAQNNTQSGVFPNPNTQQGKPYGNPQPPFQTGQNPGQDSLNQGYGVNPGYEPPTNTAYEPAQSPKEQEIPSLRKNENTDNSGEHKQQEENIRTRFGSFGNKNTNENSKDDVSNRRPEKEIPVRRKKNKIAKKAWGFLTGIIGWIINIALVFGIFYVIANYLIINAEIPSESMEPTVAVGDKIIGSRITYTLERPERGDIAIFQNPDNPSELYIKRIIGLPGETVRIVNGKIFIDDATEPLNEPYLAEAWTVKNDGLTYEVPEGHYFMLGDNRNISADSRYWENTYVPAEYLIAEAVLRYFPINEIAILNEDQASFYPTQIN